ncbi:MAG: hypothetical protein ACE5FU_12250 [Nitrospinota bacterium]
MQTKRKVSALYKNYIRFEKELESFNNRLQKLLIPSNYNISLKKAKKSKLKISRVELFIDGNMVYSSSFGKLENFALSQGGRELLFYGPLSHGRHMITFRAYVEDPKTGKTLLNQKTEKISLKKGKNTYHELSLSGSVQSPDVSLSHLGTE